MNLLKLTTENEFNKLVRGSKQNNSSVYFLFTSPWDHNSDILKNELKYLDKSITIYEVDYFNLPHTYCAFRNQVPSLVRIKGKHTKVLSNMISIRYALGLDTLSVPHNS